MDSFRSYSRLIATLYRRVAIPAIGAILLVGLVLSPTFNVQAAAGLTITPITWDIIGLDSNNVTVGPDQFPVGVRVCNTSGSPTTTVTAVFNLPAQSPNYITADAQTTLTVPSLAASGLGHCTDFYFTVTVSRNSAAYGATAPYTITASDSSGSVSTPAGRQLVIEHLISQNRNGTDNVNYGLYNGTNCNDTTGGLASVGAGGSLHLSVGNTYCIQLVAHTATHGYEQL